MDRQTKTNQEAAEERDRSNGCGTAGTRHEQKALPVSKTSKNLSDSQKQLRAILETAVEGIITIDDQGVIESANRAVEEMFGYSAEELIGQKVNILMPLPFSREHDDYLKAYKETRKKKIIGIGREVRAKKKNGDVFPIDLAVSEVKLSGRILFTGFIRDISERVELENEIVNIIEVEQRRIGQDLHDGVCQHLAGIEFMSQVLEQRLSGRSKEAARSAAEIARLVREAIKQTRDVARGLSPLSLDAGGLMSSLEELAETTEHRFGILCRFHCQEKVFIENSSHSTHFYRIAQEAVSNAIRHGEANHIRLGLERSGNQILLLVCDNGKGFGPEKMGSSTGMGIKIMNYRAQMMGASVTHEKSDLGGVCVKCSQLVNDSTET